jgi:hypothetical protein
MIKTNWRSASLLQIAVISAALLSVGLTQDRQLLSISSVRNEVLLFQLDAACEIPVVHLQLYACVSHHS